MDKKIAGLLGAVAALGTMGGAQAAPMPTDTMQANSYADLLAPVPNAMAALQADNAARSRPSADERADGVQVAEYYHHHHHHHRRVIIIRRHHHHHHHYRRYHHHHHHHSHYMAIPRDDA